MKSLKKILSIFAAFMMVVGLTAANVKANEDSQSGDITISNAVVGQTYTLYKLFDATYDSTVTPNGTVAYLATPEQVTWFNQNASSLFTFTETLQPVLNKEGNPIEGKFYSNVEAKAGINSAQIVAALKAAEEKEGAASITTIMTKVDEKQAEKKVTDPEDTKTVELKFENVGYGYYYIKSTLGALVTIDSNTPSATVNDKNETKFDKKVENLDVTSAEIGKTVTFTIDVEVFPGSGSFKVTDVMSKGLTPHNDVDVKLNNVTIGSANFTASQSTNETTKETTTVVTLSDAYLNSITSKIELTITYTATVNEEALTLKNSDGSDQDFVTNSASLDYGNTNSTDSTKIYLGQFPLEKVDGSKKQLTGAEFELYYASMENGKLVVSDKKVNLIKNDEKYYATTQDVGTNGTTTVIEVGETTIQGLEVGVYALKEIKAPNGYNLAKDPIKVEITKTVSETDNKTWTMGSTPEKVEVENLTGTELPSTGGMGTTILYVAGAILMVGAAIIFVTNKRMKHE